MTKNPIAIVVRVRIYDLFVGLRVCIGDTIYFAAATAANDFTLVVRR